MKEWRSLQAQRGGVWLGSEGCVARVKGGVGGVGGAWLDVALFFFSSSRETRAHPGFWRRSKSCSLSTRRKKLFSKTSYATVWFESTPGGRKEVIYLSHSIFFFPNMPTEKLCKLRQQQQDKDAQQSFPVLLTLTVVQAWEGECWLSYYASWILFSVFSMAGCQTNSLKLLNAACLLFILNSWF